MHTSDYKSEPLDLARLGQRIKTWGMELGFQQVGVSDINLNAAETRLREWLAAGFHGEMHYMERHGKRRSRPQELLPGTIRVICARMDYLPQARAMESVLEDADKAYISRYALGRDYHKVLRKRLQQLATRIATAVDGHQYRVFTDSAPVLEKPLAEKSGLGWIGKHTNLLNRHAGSWFFLGEIYTDLALPVDQAVSAHCGSCRRCIDICPTQAIIAPYQLDARRCISYHTIELPGSIPEAFRRAMGNRIYGCDDCQLVCPWNRYAQMTREADFAPRHALDDITLVELFAWDRSSFEKRMEGSAIRRIGHERWLRNIAVALGNAPTSDSVIQALLARRNDASPLVREHVAWALNQHA